MKTREVTLTLRPLEGNTAQGWISGDDHIHLTREAEDDPTFLQWLEAEDLSVGNFLQLQRAGRRRGAVRVSAEPPRRAARATRSARARRRGASSTAT